MTSLKPFRTAAASLFALTAFQVPAPVAEAQTYPDVGIAPMDSRYEPKVCRDYFREKARRPDSRVSRGQGDIVQGALEGAIDVLSGKGAERGAKRAARGYGDKIEGNARNQEQEALVYDLGQSCLAARQAESCETSSRQSAGAGIYNGQIGNSQGIYEQRRDCTSTSVAISPNSGNGPDILVSGSGYQGAPNYYPPATQQQGYYAPQQPSYASPPSASGGYLAEGERDANGCVGVKSVSGQIAKLCPQRHP